jgi:phage tail sheath protein FI
MVDKSRQGGSMPEYLAPGVYVEEVPSAIRPIAGVGTSTAGFVGVVEDNVTMPDRIGSADGKKYDVAKAGEPRLVTSWDGFKTSFGDIQAGNLVLAHAVYGFFNNGGTRCYIVRLPGSGAASDTTTTAGSSDTTTAAAGDAPAADSAAQPAKTTTKSSAKTSTVTAPATMPPVVAPAPADTALVTAASQATDALTAITQVTVSDLEKALTALEAIDEIALVAVPGVTSNGARKAITDHCQKPGVQDRFAILDGPLAPASVTPDAIKGNTGASDYGALYYPWIVVADPLTKSSLAVPPSGHIAGLYARVDATRGVYKAPANEVILGAQTTARPVSRAEQAGLNPAGVNVLRIFNGSVTVWGARTLASGSGNSEFQYVNVRRLFLFMRESIEEGTQWVVFEPNAAPLWARIRRNVTAFLTNLWNDGALLGAAPAEAFYVRCDEHTNPAEVRELGQVVTEIGVAVVRPAEFVVFRISQWSGPSA